jgi:hypothetical protein
MDVAGKDTREFRLELLFQNTDALVLETSFGWAVWSREVWCSTVSATQQVNGTTYCRLPAPIGQTRLLLILYLMNIQQVSANCRRNYNALKVSWLFYWR